MLHFILHQDCQPGLIKCQLIIILLFFCNGLQTCRQLFVTNLGTLKELPTFPENITKLVLEALPCLIFVSDNELQCNQNCAVVDEKLWLSRMTKSFEISYPDSPIKNMLLWECANFKQTSAKNCIEQLDNIEKAVKDNNITPLILVDWLICHQQPKSFIFSDAFRVNKWTLLGTLWLTS